MTVKTRTIVVFLACSAGLTWFLLSPSAEPGSPPTADSTGLPELNQSVIGLGYDSPMTSSGIRQPPALPAAEADIPDDAAIIGVHVDGQARAYLVSALSGMTSHVVNDVIGTIPVSVTYCDQTDCARVFTKPGHSGPIDLWQQGWVNQELSLTLDGTAFGQSSTSAPLDDLSFERTTWEDWKAIYPETDIVDLSAISPNGLESHEGGASPSESVSDSPVDSANS